MVGTGLSGFDMGNSEYNNVKLKRKPSVDEIYTNEFVGVYLNRAR